MKETKFKDTEIGRIPEEWEVRTINSFCSVKTGPFGSMLHAEDYVAKGTPIVTTEHFKNGILPLVGKDIPQIGIEDLKRMSSYTLTKDDIVFSRVGSVDINALVTVRQKGWLFSGRVLRVRPFKQTDSLYLHYGLLKHSVRSDIVSRAVGLTMASINTKILGETELSLPPLNEQRRIASALTSIDNLIASLGKLIEKKKNIKQGAMQQLLTGKTRLKGFNEPWMEHTIDELFDLGNGYTPSKSNPAYWTNGTIPWFRMEDIRTNGRILKDSIQHVTPEAVKGNGLYPKYSIILSTTATIGEHALLIADSLANQQFTFLNRKVNRRDMIDIIFFYHYCFILGKWCRDNINAGGLLAVNMDDLKNHSIYIPKSIAEQQAIATILTKMDDEITALEAKRAKYEAIKQGMMQQLLTGKIRLIG